MIISNFKMDKQQAGFTVRNNRGASLDFEIESMGIGHTSSTDPWDLYELGFSDDEVDAVDEFLSGLSSMLMVNANQGYW